MKDWESLYQHAGEFHGSLCGGTILGIHLACLDCRLIGRDDAKGQKKT